MGWMRRRSSSRGGTILSLQSLSASIISHHNKTPTIIFLWPLLQVLLVAILLPLSRCWCCCCCLSPIHRDWLALRVYQFIAITKDNYLSMIRPRFVFLLNVSSTKTTLGHRGSREDQTVVEVFQVVVLYLNNVGKNVKETSSRCVVWKIGDLLRRFCWNIFARLLLIVPSK